MPAALRSSRVGALSWSEAGDGGAVARPDGRLPGGDPGARLPRGAGRRLRLGRVALRPASRGQPQRLLVLVFALAAVTTAVLSLDATVVLLTPGRVHHRRPVAAAGEAACLRLRSPGQLGLAAAAGVQPDQPAGVWASGLSFATFAAAMALPWLMAIARRVRRVPQVLPVDLAGRSTPVAPRYSARPLVALVVLASRWPASCWSNRSGRPPVGAVVLASAALARRADGRAGADAVNLPFVAFVLGLGIVVTALQQNGLRDGIAAAAAGRKVAAWRCSLIAAIAAVLANLVNNIPATLVLLPPVAAAQGSVGVLAVLIGVNLGPNLTYVGSLATLLWRRLLRERDAEPSIGDFLRLGALTVPAGIAASVVGLWLSWQLVGG